MPADVTVMVFVATAHCTRPHAAVFTLHAITTPGASYGALRRHPTVSAQRRRRHHHRSGHGNSSTTSSGKASRTTCALHNMRPSRYLHRVTSHMAPALAHVHTEGDALLSTEAICQAAPPYTSLRPLLEQAWPLRIRIHVLNSPMPADAATTISPPLGTIGSDAHTALPQRAHSESHQRCEAPPVLQ